MLAGANSCSAVGTVPGCPRERHTCPVEALNKERRDFHLAPSAADALGKFFCSAGDRLQVIASREAGNLLARLEIVVSVL